MAAVLVGSVAPSAALAQTSEGPRIEVLAQTARVRVVRQGSWVRHEYRESMPRSTVVEWCGERIESPNGRAGCGYAQSASEAPSAPGAVRLEREVASNLSQCVLRIEVADLTEAEAARFGPRATTRERSSDTATSTSGSLSTRATTTGKYQRLYYEDPIGIDVTATTARVRWTWTGTCTTWSKHSPLWEWFGLSGWARTASWWGTHGPSCAYGATTSVTGSFQNTIFCDGIPGSSSWDTWNRYNTNYVQGKSNGWTYYEWDAQKWGGCSNLLSFRRTTGNWAG
jgi:hypothetical protein